MMPHFVYANDSDGCPISAININNIVSVEYDEKNLCVIITDTNGKVHRHIPEGYEDGRDRDNCIVIDTINEFARDISDDYENSDLECNPFRHRVDAFLYEGEPVSVRVGGEISTYEA